MLETYNEILNIRDVCSILRIERKLAYKLIKNGDIPAMKVGSAYRIPKCRLIDYIEKSTGCQKIS